MVPLKQINKSKIPEEKENIFSIPENMKNVLREIISSEEISELIIDISNEKSEIIKAFEYFDINHSGKIHITDLTRILSTFGDVMKEEEMENIFKSAGIIINSDEQVDYIKFIKFWFGNK